MGLPKSQQLEGVSKCFSFLAFSQMCGPHPGVLSRTIKEGILLRHCDPGQPWALDTPPGARVDDSHPNLSYSSPRNAGHTMNLLCDLEQATKLLWHSVFSNYQ